MRVVGRRLKSPGEFAGVGVDSNDAARPRIVARAILRGQHWRGISRPKINEIELRIVRSRDPHISTRGAAAESVRRFARKRAVKGPLLLAGFGVKRFQHSRQIVKIAGSANDNVVAHNQRGHRRPITLLHVGDDHVPFHCAVSRVEANQMRVGSGEVHGIFV